MLYEPQYYGQLLDSLTAICRMGGARPWRPATAAAAGEGTAAEAAEAVAAESGGEGEGEGAASGSGNSGAQPPTNSAAAAAAPQPTWVEGGAPGSGLARTLPLCFICYRRRRYKEDGFEAMALSRGFTAVVEVPSTQLHPDYQEGYHLIELVHDGQLRGPRSAAR